MTLVLGVCCDAANPDGSPTPEAYPFPIIRIQARPGLKWATYAQAMRNDGKFIYVVLDADSVGSDATNWPSAAASYARYFAADTWIIGNEPDAAGAASWTMSPTAYATLWSHVAPAIRRVLPTAKLSLAGMGSGVARSAALYAEAIRGQPYGAISADVHCYPQSAISVTDLAAWFAEWQQWMGRPITCLEWNPMNSGLTVDQFTQALRLAGVEAACFFCWSDAMVDGFGLFDTQGKAKPEYAALVAAAGGKSMALDTGPGLAAYIETKSDHALRDSDFRTNQDGSLFEETVGTLGTYRASNASGDWECVGPFPGPA